MGTVLYYIATTLADMLAAIPAVLAVRLAAIPLRRRAGKRTTPGHETASALLLLWVAALLAQTVNLRALLAAPGVIRSGGVNLVPLRTIVAIARYSSPGYTAVNLLGNLAIFIPVGLLPPLLWRGMERAPATLGLGFGLSLFIETAQLFTGRSTDIDDLLLNTLGALAGFGLFCLVRKAAPHAWQRLRIPPRQGE